MVDERMPRPGDIYRHFKDKLYQVITIATHTETRELMVVYQALYGDFRTYTRPLESFISEVDRIKYPEVTQKYRFELIRTADISLKEYKEIQEQPSLSQAETLTRVEKAEAAPTYNTKQSSEYVQADGEVNHVLLKFLEADSYYEKLDIISSNRKHLSDRLINDMSVALDCTVDEGSLDDRIDGLITCLQAMCRFENKRLR